MEGTGLIKMRQRFLGGGMCARHVCSNTPARQNARICYALSCLVLRGDTSGLEPPALLYSLEFLFAHCLFLKELMKSLR